MAEYTRMAYSDTKTYCSGEAHMIEVISYDTTDAKGRDRYPGKNDFIPGDLGMVMYWGVGNRYMKERYGNLYPAQEDKKPGLFKKQEIREPVGALRVQRGTLRITVPHIELHTVYATFLTGRLIVDIACDIPVDPNDSKLINDGTRQDRDLSPEDIQMLGRWSSVLSTNKALVGTSQFEENPFFKVKYITAAAVSDLFTPFMEFYAKDLFASLSNDQGTETADITRLNEKVSEALMDKYSHQNNMVESGFKIVTKPIFEYEETDEERNRRIANEKRFSAELDDIQAKELFHQFQVERAKEDMEYEKKKAEIANAARLAEMRYKQSIGEM